MKVLARKNKLFIEFVTIEKVFLDDIFKIEFSPDGKDHYFIITEADTMNYPNNSVKVLAREYGYWCTFLQRLDVDIRDITSCKLDKVSDPDKIAGIHKQACYL